MTTGSSKRLATIVQSGLCKTNTILRPQPSLFFFPGLTSKPIFDNTSFPWCDDLRSMHAVILGEYLALREKLQAQSKSDYVINKEEHKLHEGQWDWNSYIVKGRRQSDFATSCPRTVELLESLTAPSLMTSTPFSYCFFSTLHGGSSIAPHYGPCNLRLRCHFPLVVPEKAGPEQLGMQIGASTVAWQSGVPLVFDDCFVHSVWNRTAKERVVLLFDIWHPDLHKEEIFAIQDMFADAQQKGWLS